MAVNQDYSVLRERYQQRQAERQKAKTSHTEALKNAFLQRQAQRGLTKGVSQPGSVFDTDPRKIGFLQRQMQRGNITQEQALEQIYKPYNDFIGQVNGLLSSYNQFANNYNTRFGGRKYDMSDAYMGDSQQYLNEATAYNQQLIAQSNAILATLEANPDAFDKETVDSIKSSLTMARENTEAILKDAEQDNAYWNSWGNGGINHAQELEEMKLLLKKWQDESMLRKSKETGMTLNDEQKARLTELEAAMKPYDGSEKVLKNAIREKQEFLEKNPDWEAASTAEYVYQKAQQDEAFAQKYAGKSGTELVNLINFIDDENEKDWVTGEALRTLSFDEAEKDLEILKKEEKELEHLGTIIVHAENGLALTDDEKKELAVAQKRYKEVFEKYGVEDLDGLKNLIARNAQLIAESKHTQEYVRLSSVQENEDFAKYAEKGKAEAIEYAEKNKKTDHMTNKEIQVLAYYIGKDKQNGTNTAEEYKAAIKYYLKHRRAGEIADSVNGIDIPVIEGIARIGHSYTAKVMDWGMSVLQNFTDSKLDPTVYQMASGYILSDPSLNRFDRIAYNAAGVLGYMTPSILISRGLGAAGAPASLAKAAGSVAMYLGSAGNAYGEALEKGYDKPAARVFSVLVGLSEVSLQNILGGIGEFGGLPAKVAGKIDGIKNVLLKGAAKLAVSEFGEVSEELLQNYLEPLFRTFIFGEEYDEPTLQENLDTILTTLISTGTMEGPGITSETVKDAKLQKLTGDQILQHSFLTSRERVVVNTITQNLVAEAEQSGKKLSAKEKQAIYDQVVADMDTGRIDIQQIEDSIGKGAEYHQLVSERDEFKKLNSMRAMEMTGEQSDRLAELKAKNQEHSYDKAIQDYDAAFSKAVEGLVKTDRLAESYRERDRRSEAYKVEDLSKYSEKQQKVVQSAIDSGILNNTRRTHEFVDFIAKVSEKLGVDFSFTDNKRLKESGFAIDGVTVNGFVNEKGVTVNVNSPKALNSVVGHEITHVLEGTKLYDSLKKAVKAWGNTKGIYETRLKELTELYQGKKGYTGEDAAAKIEREVVADLIGDYLFTDKDFVENLAKENPGLFKRIFEEIKYLCKLVTAGSKEARQLEKAKKMFTEVAREASKDGIKNPTTEGGVKYSLESNRIINELTGEEIDGNTYSVLDRLDNDAAVTSEEIANLKEVKEGQKKANEKVERFIVEHPELGNVDREDIGTYLLNGEERKRLRERIIKERLQEGSFSHLDEKGKEVYNGYVNSDKRLDIVIGLPASGKSSSIVNPLSQYYGSVVIDSDIIKTRLPEYDGGWGSMLVHEESSAINTELLVETLKTGVNTVLPVVGSKVSSVEKYINLAKERGYSINIHLNELSNGKAVGRMLKRYFDEGRFINPSFALEYGNKPTEVYEQIKQRSDISGYSRWNNDVPKGQRPNVTEISENSRLYGTYSSSWRASRGTDIGRSDSKSKSGESQSNQIAPIQETSSKDGVFFDAPSAKNSLSIPGQVETDGQGWQVQGRDVALEQEQEGPGLPMPPGYQKGNPVAGATQKGSKPAQTAQEVGLPLPGDAIRAEQQSLDQEYRRQAGFHEDTSLYDPDEDEGVETTRDKLEVKRDNLRWELQEKQQDKEAALQAKDQLIAELQAKYDAKKHKDSKNSQALLRRIKREMRIRSDIAAEYDSQIARIQSRMGKIDEKLQTGTPEKADRLENAYKRIDDHLAVDEKNLADEYYKKREALQKELGGKSREDWIGDTAKELHWKMCSLVKGEKTTGILKALLNTGYDWTAIRHALEDIKDGWAVVPSLVENTVRDMLGRAYDDRVQELEGLETWYQEELEKLQRETEEKKRIARTAGTRKEVNARYLYEAAKIAGDISGWVDKKTGLSAKRNTLRRNLFDVVRNPDGTPNFERAQALYDWLQGTYNHNEAVLKKEMDALFEKYRKMDITKEESAYIQMLGEFLQGTNDMKKTYVTQQMLEKYLSEHRDKIDEEKCREVVNMARQDYDTLFERVNEVLRANGMAELQYVQGYFPHMQEIKQKWIQKALNIKPINHTDKPTEVAGISGAYKPNKKSQGYSKERKGPETEFNFLKGYQQYVAGVLDWIHHIPDIQRRRALENFIRITHAQDNETIMRKVKAIQESEVYTADEEQAELDKLFEGKTNPLGNFVTDLMVGTNILAGKKTAGDRMVEDLLNPDRAQVINQISSRVSANLVAGSISAGLSNVAAIPISWGEVSPISTVAEFGRAFKNTFEKWDDGLVAKSDFLTNRLRNPDKLYKEKWDNIGDVVSWWGSWTDNLVTQTIWRSKYRENLKAGMTEDAAIKNADQFAENVLAGRSRGNMPTLFESRNIIAKAFTTCQLEVNNEYGYWLKDMPREMQGKARGKLVAGYMKTFLGATLLNKFFFEPITGRSVATDPIAILANLLMGLVDDEEEEDKVILRFVEDVLQEVPLVGGVLGGGRVPVSSAMPYDNLQGLLTGAIQDISNGNWGNLASELSNPLYYLLPPMGGGQIRKTVQGLDMYGVFDWLTGKDHSVPGNYTSDGRLRYPTDEGVLPFVRDAVFGKWSGQNAQQYIEEGRSPLSEKQTKEFFDLGISIQEYWDIQDGLKALNKQSESGKAKLNDVGDYIGGLDLTTEQKNILINNIAGRKEPIDMATFGDYPNFKEFDYATQNPGKYAVSQAVGGFEEFKGYQADLSDLDKDETADYINDLDIDYGMKIILYVSRYSNKESREAYGYDIVEYLNGRDDISEEQMRKILKELGFRVYFNGTVTWD